ncbi:shikimate dehydrogenase [Candidatus Bipolaricaulota bacterium]|nr:shikimate dehydrogenase [Candidatus Bipolaricaulota bacterium]
MTDVTTTTKVLGLIGDPVSNSLSPRLQNWAIDRLGLDYRYFAFPVKVGAVKEAVIGARELGLKGLNVTVPHKKAAVEYVDCLSRAARVTGAVNTIKFGEGEKIEGDNTDWQGFLKSLELHDFDPDGKKCLVFGAGGAAAGVVYGLVRKGVQNIVIVNRTEAKGVELARKMEGLSPGVDLAARPLAGSDIGERIECSDLVVNATSVGTGSTRGEAIWDDASDFHSEQIVYDLIYNPSPTKLLKLAAESGATTIDGLDMLILQGLESLKSWTGEEFVSGETVDELRQYLRASGGLN